METDREMSKRTLGTTLLAIFTLLLGLAAALLAAPEQQQGEARSARPTATVQVLHFKKQVPQGQMSMSMGGAAPEVPRYTVNYGEEFTFSWTIKACKAVRVSATLSHAGAIELGAPTSEGDCTTYRSTKTLRITEGGTYTLRATGMPSGPASSSEKRIEIVVRRYGLEMSHVTFDPDTRKLTLFARNTGDLDIPPGEIQVNYNIRSVSEGHGPGQEYFNDQVNRRSTAVPRGRTVEFGTLHMPVEASHYRLFWMQTEVLGEPYGFPDRRQEFTFTWQAKEWRINRTALEILVAAIVGDIRFNNYDASKRTAETIHQAPLKADDSWVFLWGEKQPFSTSPINMHFSVKRKRDGKEVFGLDLRAYMNDIGLKGNRAELILGPNRLGIRLPFNTAGSREVKIFGFHEDGNEYIDDLGPDVEIGELGVDLLFTLQREEQAVKVSNIRAEIRVSSSFAGGWGVLDSIAPSVQSRVESEIRKAVDDEVARRLNNASILDQINAELARFISDRQVQRIQLVTIDNDGILIRYY